MREVAGPIALALLFGELVSSCQSRPAWNSSSHVGDALVDIGGRRLHVSCTGTEVRP